MPITNNQPVAPVVNPQPETENEQKGGCGMCNGVKFTYILSDLYSIDGFTNLAKVIIADIHLVSLIPAIGGLFDGMLKTIEAQKDLLYATAIFRSWGTLVGVKDSWTEILKKDKLSYSMKVLLAVGDIFETGGFLKKYAHFQFPRFSQAAESIGSVKIFSSRWDDLPVLQVLCTKPKDFFVFIACTLDLALWALKLKSDDEEQNKEAHKLEYYLKVTTSIGKMILIGSGRGTSAVFLSIVDFITQNVAIFRFIYVKHVEREKHFGTAVKA